MGRAQERALLAVAIVSLLPALFALAAFGPWGGLSVSLVAVAAFALWWRVRERRLASARDEAPARAPPVPVPPVDVAELEDVPEPVSACPACGYLGIRMPGIGDGLWPGGGELGDRMVCPRCAWQGLPVRFDTREDYAALLRALA